MDFVKPPTDNLYKFQALSGLLIILISLIYPLWLFHKATLGYLAAENEEAQLTIQRRFTSARQEMLGRRKTAVAAEQDDLRKRIDELKAQHKAVLTTPEETTISPGIDKLDAQLKESIRSGEALEDAAHELALSLDLKQREMEYQRHVNDTERDISRAAFVVAVIGLGIGLFYTSTGFRRWDQRVQVYQDTILKKQAASEKAASTQAGFDN